MFDNQFVIQRIQESIAVKQRVVEDTALLESISCLAEAIVAIIANGGKLVLCGNGGSASDALHFAGEIVGRFTKERCAWPAITLNADMATLTSIANDYGYEDVFARQADGLVNAGDLLIGISTSGNSENVYRACIKAHEKGALTACLVGNDGGRISKITDYAVIVPDNTTARIQECHIMIIHILCELVEASLSNTNRK